MSDFEESVNAIRTRLDETVPLDVQYDRGTDILTVNGRRFSGALFRGMDSWPEGTVFRLERGPDGVVTISLLHRGPGRSIQGPKTPLGPT